MLRPSGYVHARLSEKDALLGLMQLYPHPVFADLAAVCGYDFIVLDCEHGFVSELDILHAVQAAGGRELAVFVRPLRQDAKTIGRYLDMGIDGLLVPSVSSASEAEALVRSMSYPPTGTRGFAAALHRASDYGTALDAHKADPRGGAFLAVLIETAEGVANIDDILGVSGVDAAMIGPADLSASLSILGDYSSPAFEGAFTKLESSAKSRGKIAGAAPHGGQKLDALRKRGHRLFIVGTDGSLMRSAMSGQLNISRQALGNRPS